MTVAQGDVGWLVVETKHGDAGALVIVRHAVQAAEISLAIENVQRLEATQLDQSLRGAKRRGRMGRHGEGNAVVGGVGFPRDRETLQEGERELIVADLEVGGRTTARRNGNPDGSKLRPGQFHEILWAAQRKSGLRRIKWHELRHSFASILTTGGAPLRIVQSLLGHSTIRMTERYAHLAPGQSAGFMHLLSTVTSMPSSSGQRSGQFDPTDRAELTEIGPVLARVRKNEPNLAKTNATPAGFEPEYGPNRFADLQNSVDKLRVPLGPVGIAWRHRKAVEMGP